MTAFLIGKPFFNLASIYCDPFLKTVPFLDCRLSIEPSLFGTACFLKNHPPLWDYPFSVGLSPSLELPAFWRTVPPLGLPVFRRTVPLSGTTRFLKNHPPLWGYPLSEELSLFLISVSWKMFFRRSRYWRKFSIFIKTLLFIIVISTLAPWFLKSSRENACCPETRLFTDLSTMIMPAAKRTVRSNKAAMHLFRLILFCLYISSLFETEFSVAISKSP